MYQLFIANKNYSSWSLRPWMVLRQLDIPFEERCVTFEASGTYEKFRHFSPTGKVPCLQDGAITVWDSLAITEYIAERHVNVWPTDATARAWARSAAAEMHSGFSELRNRCPMNCGIRVRLHEASAPLKADVARIGELWNDGLKLFGGPFLAGNRFSAVDAFFAPVAFRIQTYALQLDATADAYAQRLLQLPSMQSWYRDGLAETVRDVPHDEESKRSGTWLDDLRVPAAQ